MSASGMIPPTTTRTSVRPRSASSAVMRGQTWFVRAGEDRDANHVRILLQRRLDDLLRRLAQAGVDHFHPGIAQRTGDHLRAPVVAVETRLRDDDADASRRAGAGRWCTG